MQNWVFWCIPTYTWSMWVYLARKTWHTPVRWGWIGPLCLSAWNARQSVKILLFHFWPFLGCRPLWKVPAGPLTVSPTQNWHRQSWQSPRRPLAKDALLPRFRWKPGPLAALQVRFLPWYWLYPSSDTDGSASNTSWGLGQRIETRWHG